MEEPGVADAEFRRSIAFIAASNRSHDPAFRTAASCFSRRETGVDVGSHELRVDGAEDRVEHRAPIGGVEGWHHRPPHGDAVAAVLATTPPTVTVGEHAAPQLGNGLRAKGLQHVQLGVAQRLRNVRRQPPGVGRTRASAPG